MNRLFVIIQAMFLPQDTDGFYLFWAKEILGALLILSMFWMLAQVVTMLLNKWGKRLAASTATDLDDRLLERIIPHASKLLIILGFYLAIRYLPLHEKIVAVTSGALYIFLVVIIFSLIYQSINELLQRYIAKQQGSSALISRHMIPIAEKIIMLFLMGTALIIVLKHFNYDIFSIVTALGIGSLAIGLAAKDTLAHMISGFTLMLDRPFRIGDRIQLSGGQIGVVADIGLRSTKIKTPDNMLLIIPNSDLCNTILLNQTFSEERGKGRINIGVAYGSNVDLVKQVLVKTALEIEDVLRDPAPEAFLVAFGDSSLNMSLFFWVEEYGKVFAVTDKINSLILHNFSENGIEIPFPTRLVRVENLENAGNL